MLHLFSLKIMNLGMQSCLFFSSRNFFYLVKNNCKSRINCYHFSSFEENDFFFSFWERPLGFYTLESKYAVGGAGKCAAFSLLEIGSIISPLHADWLFTVTYNPCSKDFHIWPRAVSLPPLFLLSSLCVSYLLGCDHHQLFSMGESLFGYLLGIYAFTHIKCLYRVPVCVWRPVFAPSYLKDCPPVLDSSPFGVRTPSSPALSTSTSFVHFIFHACSFTRLAAHCSNLLITHLSLRPTTPHPTPACSCSLVSDQYKSRLLRYTGWYFWSNTRAFRL